MHRHRSILTTAAAALVGAAVASCGGSGHSGAVTTAGAATTVTGVLGTASTPLGRVLVDHGGRTVYVLTADGPGSSRCDAACLRIWPPVPAPRGAAPAPVGGIPARLGVARSSGGAVVLTAAGRPLYTFAQDTAPGQVNGQRKHGFGGTWYVVSPSGAPITSAPSQGGSDGSGGGSGGGGGYGY
jgi:predicted lipoprotein with Yx(FWY)xxD motif